MNQIGAKPGVILVNDTLGRTPCFNLPEGKVEFQRDSLGLVQTEVNNKCFNICPRIERGFTRV